MIAGSGRKTRKRRYRSRHNRLSPLHPNSIAGLSAKDVFMKASNGNTKLKIFRGIFASFNLVLICAGLVSCVAQAPKPLAPIEQQKPVLQPDRQNPNGKDNDDKVDDSNDDRDNDDKDRDDKNGDDKD